MAQVGSEAKGSYVSWGITFLSFSISFSPTVSSSQASDLLTLWLESQSFVSLSDNREIFIYLKSLSTGGQKEKEHTLKMLPTLFREPLWRENCSVPQSVPRSHSSTSMGLQPQRGTQRGNGFLPFLSLSLSLLLSISQNRMTVFPWSSRPVLVWSIISGSMLPWGPNWELWEEKKTRGREDGNSPPDPPSLDLFVPSPWCLLPFAFWTLQVAALCTLFTFWFHPVGEKE